MKIDIRMTLQNNGKVDIEWHEAKEKAQKLNCLFWSLYDLFMNS